MIGSRTRYSLAQYLDLHEENIVETLMNKHGIRFFADDGRMLTWLTGCLLAANEEGLFSLVQEIVQTPSALRARVNPKGKHDERYSDLCRCLQLDGYLTEGKKLTQADPSIGDAPSLDDDLFQELKATELPAADEIANKINDSSAAFRSSTPNYNACLTDIRIALQTLAREIASTRQLSSTPPYEQDKWGSVLGFLKAVGFITQEDEKGLAGVYGFVSPGAHRPMGITEEQRARLGRSLALGMCWFLVKSYRAGNSGNGGC